MNQSRASSWRVFLVAASLASLAAGCSSESGPPTDDGGSKNAGSLDGGSEDGGSEDGGGPISTYAWLEVEDVGGADSEAGGTDPGADIDAIVLIKNGTRYPAVAIEHYQEATGSSLVNTDPSKALGEPDNVAMDGATCDGENGAGYVSLGGMMGGALVVSFGGVGISTGDTVVVYEVGGCSPPGGGALPGESLSIAVANGAVAPQPAGSGWQNMGVADSNASGLVSYTIR